MIGYFRGWRVKFGLVLLFMACAFLAIWIKSLSVGTEIAFGQDAQDLNSDFKKHYNIQDEGWHHKKILTRTLSQVIARKGLLVWRRLVVTNPEWRVGYPVGWRDTNYDAFATINKGTQGRDILGFNFGVATQGEENVTHVGFDPTKRQSDPELKLYVWQIPLWSVVLTLTLLAGWLLIGRRKKAVCSATSKIELAKADTMLAEVP